MLTCLLSELSNAFQAGSVDVAPRTTTTAMRHAALALRTVAAAQPTELVNEANVAVLKISKESPDGVSWLNSCTDMRIQES